MTNRQPRSMNSGSIQSSRPGKPKAADLSNMIRIFDPGIDGVGAFAVYGKTIEHAVANYHNRKSEVKTHFNGVPGETQGSAK